MAAVSLIACHAAVLVALMLATACGAPEAAPSARVEKVHAQVRGIT